jgi:hypothetical protein
MFAVLVRLFPALFQTGEIFQQYAVYKDVAAAHLAQQHPLSGIVEEAM